MPDINAGITTLIQTQIETARDLLAILREEHRALKSNDPAAIEAAASAKIREVAALEDLHQRHSHSPDANQPDTAPPVPPHARHHWSTLKSLLRQCAEQNTVNGQLLMLRKNHVHNVLHILRGTPDQARACYGPRGDTASGIAPQTLAKV